METLVTAVTNSKASFFPSLDRKTMIALGLSGVAATIAFDFFGQVVSPALGFVNLVPVQLATMVSFADVHNTTTPASALDR